jgi:hypothetical protein
MKSLIFPSLQNKKNNFDLDFNKSSEMRSATSFVVRKDLEQESKKPAPVFDYNLWLNFSGMAEVLSGRFMAAVKQIFDKDNQ